MHALFSHAFIGRLKTCVVAIGVVHFSCVASVEATHFLFTKERSGSMNEYEKIYAKMFNGITDTIENLKNLQIEVEQEFIEMGEKNTECKKIPFNPSVKSKKD